MDKKNIIGRADDFSADEFLAIITCVDFVQVNWEVLKSKINTELPGSTDDEKHAILYSALRRLQKTIGIETEH